MQDWNASRKEVEELVALGVISEEELARVIGIEVHAASFHTLPSAFRL